MQGHPASGICRCIALTNKNGYARTQTHRYIRKVSSQILVIQRLLSAKRSPWSGDVLYYHFFAWCLQV